MQDSITDARTDDLCTRVVDAVADAIGEDPVTMTPPLGSVVDVDALTTVVDSAESVSVSFEYEGVAVVVHGDGAVSATPAAGDEVRTTRIGREDAPE